MLLSVDRRLTPSTFSLNSRVSRCIFSAPYNSSGNCRRLHPVSWRCYSVPFTFEAIAPFCSIAIYWCKPCDQGPSRCDLVSSPAIVTKWLRNLCSEDELLPYVSAERYFFLNKPLNGLSLLCALSRLLLLLSVPGCSGPSTLVCSSSVSWSICLAALYSR